MIFLVVDETSGIYFEAITANSEVVAGRLHLVFLDKRFINEFIDLELDYLILYFPYKHFNSMKLHEPLPQLTIFGIKNIKNKNIPLYNYDEDRMVSSEK